MINNKYFKKVFFLSQNVSKTLILLFLSVIILGLLELMGIYFFIPLINKILSHEVFLTNFDMEKQILELDKSKIFILIFLIFLFKSILNVIFISLKSNTIKQLINYLSQTLLLNYLSKNLEFYTNFSAASLIRNLNTEIPAFANRTLLVLINIINDLIILISITAFLLFFSFKETILIIVFFVLIFSLFILTTKKKIYLWGDQRIFPEKERIKTAEEIFYGIRELKLFSLEKIFFDKYKKFNYKVLSLLTKESILSQMPRIFFEIFFIAFLLFFLFFAVSKNINDVILTMGIYVLSFSRILPAISRIVSSINSLRFSSATVNLLFNQFTKILVDKNDFSEKKIEFKNSIIFKNVFFKYNNLKSNNVVLKNINLEIHENKIYGFSGKSGSGKSTLLDLIIGFVSLSDGEILVNNIKKSKNCILSNATYVSQNNFILNDTIKNNIILFKKFFDEKKFYHVLKKINLLDKVNSLKDGENTILGEGGVNLSGGEKQRLALARALYLSPKLILLDEFTSALDKKNERDILKIVKELSKETTIIISTHKPEIMDICDKKFFINEGQINESN